MSSDFYILCIFTQHGHTFTFRNGEIKSDTDTMLVFSYTSMSDGDTKIGKFPKNNLCGWSIKIK